MNLLERFRNFWRSAPAPDHPLTAEERREDQPASAYDELARAAEGFVGADVDPDEPRSGRTD
jgi:hypothetical protein